MGRPPCCDKTNVKRGPWTPDEDAKILAYVASHGIGNWTLVPQKAGLNRCGKSCRLRWTNYLRPDLKHDNFTPEEEECILQMHKTIGSSVIGEILQRCFVTPPDIEREQILRWSLIARQLPGRTDNDVKNYWNTKLKKKLTKMGIDPITHKPFTQLFTEYGKIRSSHITTNPSPFLQTFSNDSIHTQENNARKMAKFTGYDITICPVETAVSDQENVEPHFFNEGSSFDAFSSSDGVMRFGCGPRGACEHPQAQMVPSSPFSKNEYILGEPFSSMDQILERKNDEGMVKLRNEEEYGETRITCGVGCSSGAADTFVEDMLAHDSEMRLQFPDIFSENYDY